MTDEDYRAMLRRVANVDSSRDLDAHAFDLVMEELHRLGFTSNLGARTFGYRHGMATPVQIEKIRELWSEFTRGQGDDRSLGNWLERQFKVSALKFLTSDTATKAIRGLIAMRNRAKRDAAE